LQREKRMVRKISLKLPLMLQIGIYMETEFRAPGMNMGISINRFFVWKNYGYGLLDVDVFGRRTYHDTAIVQIINPESKTPSLAGDIRFEMPYLNSVNLCISIRYSLSNHMNVYDLSGTGVGELITVTPMKGLI